MSSSAAAAEADTPSSNPLSSPENGSHGRKDPLPAPLRPLVGPPRPTTANVAPVIPPKSIVSKVKAPGVPLLPKAASNAHPSNTALTTNTTLTSNNKIHKAPLSNPLPQASPAPLSAMPASHATLKAPETDLPKGKRESPSPTAAPSPAVRLPLTKETQLCPTDTHNNKSETSSSKASPEDKADKIDKAVKTTLPTLSQPLPKTPERPPNKETPAIKVEETRPADKAPKVQKEHPALNEEEKKLTTPVKKSQEDLLQTPEIPSLGTEDKTTREAMETREVEKEKKVKVDKDEAKKTPPSTTQEEKEVAEDASPIKLPELKPKIAVKRKRASLSSSSPKEPSTPVRESKRSRVQVMKFQSPNPELQQIIRSFKGKSKENEAESTTPVKAVEPTALSNNTPSTDKYKDAVFFKGEHLAVRNAEGSFYICQANQNIFRTSKKIRIQWLSESPEDNPDNDVFIPEYYDKTDFETILTSVEMEKLDKKRFRLTKIEGNRIKNILQKSVQKEEGKLESDDVDISEDNPDGLDISLYKDEDQLKELERKKRLEERRMKKQALPSSSPAKKTTSSSKQRRVSSGGGVKRKSLGSPLKRKKVPVVPRILASSSKKKSNNGKTTAAAVGTGGGKRSNINNSTKKKKKKASSVEDSEEDEDEFFEIMPTPKKRKSVPESSAAVEESPGSSSSSKRAGGRRKTEAAKS
eukprot:TRINITY_DN1612_c0_g1_i3.p1 TRINITY_DN1612_c0_g1~~TRINITY_DN1612_c0_g1_i3.p1  ORF type:complete len:696 (-),score=262.72 TRINITY_DN1612_c0_g1_i3:1351-3438(-)